MKMENIYQHLLLIPVTEEMINYDTVMQLIQNHPSTMEQNEVQSTEIPMDLCSFPVVDSSISPAESVTSSMNQSNEKLNHSSNFHNLKNNEPCRDNLVDSNTLETEEPSSSTSLPVLRKAEFSSKNENSVNFSNEIPTSSYSSNILENAEISEYEKHQSSDLITTNLNSSERNGLYMDCQLEKNYEYPDKGTNIAKYYEKTSDNSFHVFTLRTRSNTLKDPRLLKPKTTNTAILSKQEQINAPCSSTSQKNSDTDSLILSEEKSINLKDIPTLHNHQTSNENKNLTIVVTLEENYSDTSKDSLLPELKTADSVILSMTELIDTSNSSISQNAEVVAESSKTTNDNEKKEMKMTSNSKNLICLEANESDSMITPEKEPIDLKDIFIKQNSQVSSENENLTINSNRDREIEKSINSKCLKYSKNVSDSMVLPEQKLRNLKHTSISENPRNSDENLTTTVSLKENVSCISKNPPCALTLQNIEFMAENSKAASTMKKEEEIEISSPMLQNPQISSESDNLSIVLHSEKNDSDISLNMEEQTDSLCSSTSQNAELIAENLIIANGNTETRLETFSNSKKLIYSNGILDNTVLSDEKSGNLKDISTLQHSKISSASIDDDENSTETITMEDDSIVSKNSTVSELQKADIVLLSTGKRINSSCPSAFENVELIAKNSTPITDKRKKLHITPDSNLSDNSVFPGQNVNDFTVSSEHNQVDMSKISIIQNALPNKSENLKISPPFLKKDMGSPFSSFVSNDSIVVNEKSVFPEIRKTDLLEFLDENATSNINETLNNTISVPRQENCDQNERVKLVISVENSNNQSQPDEPILHVTTMNIKNLSDKIVDVSSHFPVTDDLIFISEKSVSVSNKKQSDEDEEVLTKEQLNILSNFSKSENTKKFDIITMNCEISPENMLVDSTNSTPNNTTVMNGNEQNSTVWSNVPMDVSVNSTSSVTRRSFAVPNKESNNLPSSFVFTNTTAFKVTPTTSVDSSLGNSKPQLSLTLPENFKFSYKSEANSTELNKDEKNLFSSPIIQNTSVLHENPSSTVSSSKESGLDLNNSDNCAISNKKTTLSINEEQSSSIFSTPEDLSNVIENIINSITAEKQDALSQKTSMSETKNDKNSHNVESIEKSNFSNVNRSSRIPENTKTTSVINMKLSENSLFVAELEATPVLIPNLVTTTEIKSPSLKNSMSFDENTSCLAALQNDNQINSTNLFFATSSEGSKSKWSVSLPDEKQEIPFVKRVKIPKKRTYYNLEENLENIPTDEINETKPKKIKLDKNLINNERILQDTVDKIATDNLTQTNENGSKKYKSKSKKSSKSNNKKDLLAKNKKDTIKNKDIKKKKDIKIKKDKLKKVIKRKNTHLKKEKAVIEEKLVSEKSEMPKYMPLEVADIPASDYQVATTSSDHESKMSTKRSAEEYDSLVNREESHKAKKRKTNTPKIQKKECTDIIYHEPFKYGWKREIVYRAPTSSHLADVYYYLPNGRKVRSSKQLQNCSLGELTLENFTFQKAAIGINDPEKEIVRNSRKVDKKTPKKKIIQVSNENQHQSNESNQVDNKLDHQQSSTNSKYSLRSKTENKLKRYVRGITNEFVNFPKFSE